MPDFRYLFCLLLLILLVPSIKGQSDHANDSTKKAIYIQAMRFIPLSQPASTDTSLALQIFTHSINEDIFQSLYLDPNRNAKSGYDFSRSQNYRGLFKFNRYTVHPVFDGGYLVKYWHLGENKADFGRRSLNIHF